MMLLDRKSIPRTLYIIAPTLYQCELTARAHGLDSRTMQHTRSITRAYQLRGTSAGTAFITHGREFWADTSEGYDLDTVVTTLQRTGKLRIAQPDDLEACRPFDALPSRPYPVKSARAGL